MKSRLLIRKASEINSKLNKLFEGNSSIEYINKKLEEIKSSQRQLETSVKLRIENYEKAVKAQQFSEEHRVEKLKLSSAVFSDFVIVDGKDSKDGPSNWELHTDGENVELFQTSQIDTGNFTKMGTKLLSKDKFYFEFTLTVDFISKSKGVVGVLIDYENDKNYLSVEMTRGDKGELEIIEMSNGDRKMIAKLNCDEMIGIFGECQGLTFDKKNRMQVNVLIDSIEVILQGKKIFEGVVKRYKGSRKGVFNNRVDSFRLLNFEVGRVNLVKQKLKVSVPASIKKVELPRKKDDFFKICESVGKAKICQYLKNLSEIKDIEVLLFDSDAIRLKVLEKCKLMMMKETFCSKIASDVETTVKDVALQSEPKLKNMIDKCGLEKLPFSLRNTQLCKNGNIAKITSKNELCLKGVCSFCCEDVGKHQICEQKCLITK